MRDASKIWPIFMFLIVKEVWNQLCADPAIFGQFVNSGMMSPGTPFKEFSNIGIVQCMQTCIQHALCKSINFKDNHRCELFSRNNLTLLSNPNALYSARVDWPEERIAGTCANHDCAKNSQCVPQTNGSIACIIIGCVAPSNHSGYNHHSGIHSKPLWSEGETVIVSCSTSQYGKVQVICEATGKWSDRTCLPVDCADAATKGMSFSSDIEIDVDGPAGNLASFMVKCEENSPGYYATIVEHNTGVLEAKNHELSYSQHFVIDYDADLAAITRLINISTSCSQGIHVKCKNVLTQNEAAWVTRRNESASYFVGNDTTYEGCTCGLTQSCDRSDRNCNCDTNDNNYRYDNGDITNMDDLPVIGYRAGDTGSDSEEAFITIRPLRCS